LKIGAVSRLTGLSVHALRKWEERYSAVKPLRTPGGGRLYTREDVQRLALIKSLTQAGAPLSEIARSSLAELQETGRGLLIELAEPAGDRPTESLRIAVVGDALPMIVKARQGEAEYLEFVACASSMEEAQLQLAGGTVDLLVREYPSVHEDTAQALIGSMVLIGAHRAISVYGFASRAALDAFRRAGIGLMRAPVDPTELDQMARGLMYGHRSFHSSTSLGAVAESAGSDVPAPRFSREALIRAALSTPAMRCECPHHLADIISSLLAFERYSVECENRNSEDAELHHYLAVTAGHSRAAFEEALARVAAAEGIDLAEA
jgi:DNA-binding transcriptional MerR regulator